ncbi:MAG: diguanylate cyclase [Hydrogenophilales bacterium]|nr:diguanylate cyclase [Hydrogenophilales bacterium]
MRGLTLQTKLLASLAALLAAALTVLAYVLIDESRQRRDEFTLEQARYQAQMLADASVDAVASEDFELMERWIRAALPSSGYAYAALVRTNGQVLTHSDTSQIGKHAQTQTEPASAQRDYTWKNRPVHEIIHPVRIGQRHLANAHIAYFTDTKTALGAQTQYKIGMVLIAVLLLLGAAAWLVSRSIIQPIGELTLAVSKTTYEQGAELSGALLHRRDEIGILANAFANMAHSLVEAFRLVKQSNAELEQRVAARTHDLHDANLAIEASHARVMAIMENVADGILTVDANGRIDSCNQAIEQLFGYRQQDLIGQPVDILFGAAPSSGAEAGPTDMEHSTTRAGVVELTGRHQNGSTFPLEIAWSTLDQGNLRVTIGIARDISQQKQVVEHLQHFADHDALTGLYNRRHFEAELGRVVERTRRGRAEQCALMFLDLDHFKQVNDTLGHAAGDHVLIEVAQHIKTHTRKSDLAARLGGDEFAILLYNITKEQALLAADTLRRALDETDFRYELTRLDIGCSIGVTLIQHDIPSANAVMERADQACYQAKRAGRNLVRLFQTGDPASLKIVTPEQ